MTARFLTLRKYFLNVPDRCAGLADAWRFPFPSPLSPQPAKHATGRSLSGFNGGLEVFIWHRGQLLVAAGLVAGDADLLKCCALRNRRLIRRFPACVSHPLFSRLAQHLASLALGTHLDLCRLLDKVGVVSLDTVAVVSGAAGGRTD